MTNAGAQIGRYLGAGNLDAAEYVCRRILAEKGADRDVALLGLASIARRYGRYQHEALFFQALVMPFATPFADPLTLDHVVPGQTSPNDRPRYLLINAWGEGFWSDVSHVVGCCALAWLSNRIPITNWRMGSLYADRRGPDGFLNFFEPIGTTTTTDLDLDALSIFPDYWTPDRLLGRSGQALPNKFAGPGMADLWMSDADVVVCDKHVSPAGVLQWIIPAAQPARDEVASQIAALLARCCRPVARWRQAARAYVDQAFGGSPYLAFHLRGTDKSREHRRSETIARRVADTVEAIAGDRPLFLMTDDADWQAAMVARFGERLHCTDARRTSGRAGVHRSPTDPAHRRRQPRRQLGGDILCDSLIAAGADIFVGDGESNVAAMVDLMMPPRTSRSELVSPNQLLEPRDWVVSW